MCGNGVCELPYLLEGEDCGNCPSDCGPCQPFGDDTRCVENGVFAFTIDDGPSPVTPQLLSVLATSGVTASFFLLGRNVDTYPGTVASEYAQRHSLGSHSYSHTSLTTLSLLEVPRLVVLFSFRCVPFPDFRWRGCAAWWHVAYACAAQ